MKKIFESKKGITLVALVITIILLLILAGISIATLTGSGLFEKARSAEQKSKNAQELEDSTLKDYENSIGKYLNGTYRDGNLGEESKKIGELSINVVGDGNKLKISCTESDSIYGYIYFVDNKVKKVSEECTAEIIEDYAKTYKVYVIAIDEDGKLKKSNEINFTTGNVINIFNGQETDTSITGGFNTYFTVKSDTYNYSYYTTRNSKNCFLIQASYSGNYGIVTSKNKINVESLSSILYKFDAYTNHSNLVSNVYVGIAEDNSSNTNFVRVNKIENIKTIDEADLGIDVSDLTGEYYMKFMIYHNTNVSDHSVRGCLYNIHANELGRINK